MKQTILVFIIGFLFIQLSFGQNAEEKIDTLMISKIKDEGLNRSKVMEILSNLTDIYGPRLTGSPEYKQAAEWAKSKMTEWGVQNVYFDTWPFGKGWSLKRFSANVLEPRAFPLIAYPKAWSPGVKGFAKGKVIHLDVKSKADLEKYKGKLKGAFVLLSESVNLKPQYDAPAKRLNETELLKLANAGMPKKFQINFPIDSLSDQKLEFCLKEGALAALNGSEGGSGGTIFLGEARVPSNGAFFLDATQAYDPRAPKIIPQVCLAGEQYNRLMRMVKAGKEVTMEMNLEVEFSKNAVDGMNIIGEIPGTDKSDEVVMIGAHFDSWHSGTGATDNGTGSAVCLEAMRILKALDITPRRTIRIGLWGGEEEGLLGSREYVKKHFGERAGGALAVILRGDSTLTTKPENEKISAYFNNDNGTGKVRGVYLEGNEAAMPIFRAWLTPFESLGASTLSLSPTIGTDHQSFDAVGIPGFQFIQDPIEYGSRTHHSNMDFYERAQEDDLKQAAIIMASFAYNAAMREAKIPRKPVVPKP